ncbi:MAG: hypothetical protein GQ574_12170 [Crocinitomix sp.]|nr:hypothetical protein [Crocinitomix sp.]
MGTWTHIRTEGDLGPDLSKTFQSFVHGPEIDGEACELHQIEKQLNQDLTPFTIRNYSGLWHEDEFPEESSERERLMAKQIEKDKIWNDITDFLKLVAILKSKLKSGFFSKNKLFHKQEWWDGYFEPTNTKDCLVRDLEVIETYLSNAKNMGKTNTAFYVE